MAGHLWQFLLCLFFVCKRVALGGIARGEGATNFEEEKSIIYRLLIFPKYFSPTGLDFFLPDYLYLG